jgi:ATPase subunit of ABC transporter with duplicated ATPase domains
MEADGFIQPVAQDRVFTFRFADVEKLPPPVLSFDDVTFSYSGKAKDTLYEHLDLGVDMDSRTALVGPNGVGKSTLLRLMTGKLSSNSGVVSRHTHLKLEFTVSILLSSSTLPNQRWISYGTNTQTKPGLPVLETATGSIWSERRVRPR